MGYVSKQLKADEIPLSSSGASLGIAHQLYKNAVVYVDGSMRDFKTFPPSSNTYLKVYTYGRTSDGYINSSNLKDPDNGINTNLYPISCDNLPSGYLTQAEKNRQTQSINSSSD